VVGSDVSQFLRDASSFITSSHEAIERSAPHIYLSALPFTPKSSLVYQTFSSYLTGIPVIETCGIDRADKHCIMVLARQASSISSIAYSPDGNIIASCSREQKVRLWDSRSGAETCAPLFLESDAQRYPGGPIFTDRIISIAYTPKGDRLVAGTNRGKVIVCDIRTSRLALSPLHLHASEIRSVAVSPDGETIASASEDKTIALCRPNSDSPVGSILRGHTDEVNCVSFSSDGVMLASGGKDGTIYFWDYRLSRSSREPLRNGKGDVSCIAFSKDGILLASGSNDSVVRVWNVPDGQQVCAYSGHQSWVHGVAFAPDGNTLASASCDKTVHIWNLRGPSQTTALLVLRGHSGSVRAVSFSKDGHYLASGSFDGTVRVWSTSSQSSPDLQMDELTNSACAVALSRDNRLIVSGSYDGTIRVWDAQMFEQIYPPLIGHEGPVKSIALSSNSRWIATGSKDTTVRLWNAQTGQPAMAELRWHARDVTCVAFSPNDSYLASGSRDKTLRVWNIVTGQPAKISPIHCDNFVTCVAYSPGGGIIALGDSGGNIRTFDALTGQALQVVSIRKPNSGGFNQCLMFEYESDSDFDWNSEFLRSLAFSPDGAQIAAASDQHQAVIDVPTGQCTWVYSGCIYSIRSSRVRSIAYAADGQFTASREDGKSVLLWNQTTEENEELVLRGHVGLIFSVSFSFDGRFLVTSCQKNTVRLWNVDRAIQLATERGSNPFASLAFAEYAAWESWLVSPSNELLLWVPPEYYGHLEIGGHSRIIGTRRIIITGEDDVLHQGEQWTRCWRIPDANIS